MAPGYWTRTFLAISTAWLIARLASIIKMRDRPLSQSLGDPFQALLAQTQGDLHLLRIALAAADQVVLGPLAPSQVRQRPTPGRALRPPGAIRSRNGLHVSGASLGATPFEIPRSR